TRFCATLASRVGRGGSWDGVETRLRSSRNLWTRFHTASAAVAKRRGAERTAAPPGRLINRSGRATDHRPGKPAPGDAQNPADDRRAVEAAGQRSRMVVGGR